MASLTKHSKYYYKDGNITIQAGTVLFKVHMSLLIEFSEFFADLFSNAEPGPAGEGTEQKPLILHEVSADTFELILQYRYHALSVNLRYVAKEQLVDFLRATTRLRCPSIHRVVANYALETFSLADKLDVGLGHCGLDHWASSAFQELLHDSTSEMVLRVNSSLHTPHSAICWAAIYKARVTIQRLRTCNLASVLDEYGGKPGCGKKSLCVPHIVALWHWSESCASSESFLKELEPLRAQCAVCQECEVVPAAAIFKELSKWADPDTEPVVRAAWDSVPIQRKV